MPRERRARIRRRSLVALAGTLLLGAAIAAVVVLVPKHGSQARDEVRITSPLHGASASLRRAGAAAELQIAGLPQPPIGEVYEVWLIRPGTPPQATDALFTVASSGSASVDVPGSLRGVREVMVTDEPLGGSTSPTSLAVLRVRLARH